MLERCRVVLVRTHFPGNLGSVARAMRNFGLSDLVLVSPFASTGDPEARRMATHGLSLLDAARTVPDLGEAVADCGCVLATAGLADGKFRQTFVGPPEAQLPKLLAVAEAAPVALVFGPEPHGLANDEITRCHGLVHIPVDPFYPSLNLSQAVTVCLYELRKQWSRKQNEEGRTEATGRPAAPHADLERMFAHLRTALESMHYLYGTKAEPLMHAVRHLVARAVPTPQEVKLLHGLARQLLYLTRTTKIRPQEEVTELGLGAGTPPDDA